MVQWLACLSPKEKIRVRVLLPVQKLESPKGVVSRLENGEGVIAVRVLPARELMWVKILQPVQKIKYMKQYKQVK